MSVKLNNKFKTTVPTHKLVGSLQALLKAIAQKDWYAVRDVADGLNAIIKECTAVPRSLDMMPSGYSLAINRDDQEGILTQDGGDVLCIGGLPVSNAYEDFGCGGCKHYMCDCHPDSVEVLLKDGLLYTPGCPDEEDLVNFLNGKTKDVAAEDDPSLYVTKTGKVYQMLETFTGKPMPFAEGKHNYTPKDLASLEVGQSMGFKPGFDNVNPVCTTVVRKA